MAQISLLKEYQFLRRDSGAIQSGEPTLYLLQFFRSLAFIPKPKSAIFNQFSSVSSKFAGFRSRWMMLLIWKARQPFISCCMQAQTSGYERDLLIFFASSESHNYVIMQVLFLVVKISWTVRILGRFLSYFSSCISESSSALLIQLLSSFKSITLIATFSSE